MFIWYYIKHSPHFVKLIFNPSASTFSLYSQSCFMQALLFTNKKSIAMKLILSKTLALVAIAATLLSFSSNFGGEGFEISLNGKIVLQQFGKDMDAVKNLQINNSSPNDKLNIRYYHCGRIGKNRVVTIKDGQNKLIKEWKFKDAQTATGDMRCTLQDLISLKTNGNNVFKLYYSSSELPEGRMLASVTLGNSNLAARK